MTTHLGLLIASLAAGLVAGILASGIDSLFRRRYGYQPPRPEDRRHDGQAPPVPREHEHVTA
jgi:hypothetical protein